MSNAINVLEIGKRYAGYDMARARKYGETLIVQTKSGNISLRFNSFTKIYTAVNFNSGNLLCRSDARTLKAWLAQQYVIDLQ